MRQLFGRRKKSPRVLVLGLDCADPHLVFDQFRADLPILNSLMQQGSWGKLKSATPCITIPAWSSMLSSRDPGVLGCYGFRNRVSHDYHTMEVANSSAIQVKRVWDYVGEAGKQSVVIGVPQTYPLRPLQGAMVSGLLTPSKESAFTYPAVFKQEVLNVTPDYEFDIKGFRTLGRARLLQRIIDFTDIQFRLVQHSLKSKPWGFFMYVNMGVDRIHHGFWRYHDPQHRLHEPTSPFVSAIRDYYRMVDSQIGCLVETVSDDVAILVVSDHGAKRMDGGICLNEWLWRKGYLTLKRPPADDTILPFEQAEVDWSRTRVWASGGYYGRVFFNVAGREPQGIVPMSEYESLRDELAAQLAAIPDAAGQPLATQVFKPEAIYQQVRNIAPDLIVYFGDLHWRAIGSLGHGHYHTLENDTGPDDANHAEDGLFIWYDPQHSGKGPLTGHQLMDIAPTVLHQMGVSIPKEMQGSIIDR